MRRLILLLTSVIFAITVFADSPDDPKNGQNPDNVIEIDNNTGDNRLRMPSDGIRPSITGYYNPGGVLYLYPDADTVWTITITTDTDTYCYSATTVELCNGIHIGALNHFTIVMTAESGETFSGTYKSV